MEEQIGTAADRAHAELKRAIMDGSLPPGATVSEYELSARLEMSRTPVHQALDRLRVDGWVIITPRSGVTISALDAAQMRDVFETLIALEGAAALRFDASDTSAVNALERAARECEAALENEDLLAWAHADDHFHSLLVSECGNRELARVAAPVLDQAQRARLLTVRFRPWPTSSNQDHREILECIQRGDHEGARVALKEHRERGMAIVLPIIEKMYASTPSFLARR